MEISVVCVAARLSLDVRERTCRNVRIALGAVGARTVRAAAAERMLEGSAPSAELFREAGRIAAKNCAPISDVRASADYRRRIVAILVARALALCHTRIEEARG